MRTFPSVLKKSETVMYKLILSISLISLTACASMYPKTFYTLEKGTNLKIIDMQDSGLAPILGYLD